MWCGVLEKAIGMPHLPNVSDRVAILLSCEEHCGKTQGVGPWIGNPRVDAGFRGPLRGGGRIMCCGNENENGGDKR